MILHRYFAIRFLKAFAGVFAIFALIMTFLDLVEQLRKFANTEATFADIVGLTMLNVPQGIYAILPLIMIIATITLFRFAAMRLRARTACCLSAQPGCGCGKAMATARQ